MSNYQNIKPYADLSHVAALSGGPEKYITLVEARGYDSGFLDGEDKGLRKGVIGGIVGTLVTFSAFAFIATKIRDYKDIRAFKKALISSEAEKEKADFIACFSEPGEPRNSDTNANQQQTSIHDSHKKTQS